MPPTVKRGLVRFGAVWLGILAVPFAGYWLSPGVMAVLQIAVTSLMVGLGSLFLFMARDKMRRSLVDYPTGLCTRCEHPLPPPLPNAGLHEDLVTCTECGLARARDEFVEDWTFWMGGKV